MKIKLLACILVLLLLESCFTSCGILFGKGDSGNPQESSGEAGSGSGNAQDSGNAPTDSGSPADSNIPDDSGNPHPGETEVPIVDDLGLSYGLTGYGTSYAVTGIGSFTGSELVVPTSYNGKPVTEIGSNAFKNCTTLTKITMTVEILMIGDNAFAGCTALREAVIPDSISSIGNGAFMDCTALTSIHIPDSVLLVGQNAFKGCTALTSVSVPNSITSLADGVFMGCTGLESVLLPNALKSIGAGTFEGCSALKEILFPVTLQTIGDRAFKNCVLLVTVLLPENVTALGSGAFSGCTALVTVYIKSAKLPTGLDDAIDGVTKVEVSHTVHDWKDYPAKAATCTERGWNAYRACTACGESDIVYIAATSHTPVTDPAVAATCTAKGKTAGQHCATCKAVLVAQKDTEMIAHRGGEWIIDQEASCTVAGEKHRSCMMCNKVLETVAITAGNHVDVDENDICDLCKAYSQPEYTEGLVFTISISRSSYVVTDYNGTESDVVIPRSYEELPVTEIGEKAFFGCDVITSVDVPNSVTRIQDKAFSECESLESISFSDAVTLGTDVFRGTIHVEIVLTHYLVHVPAKEATCTEPGNVEYYWCEPCGMYYSDKEGENRLYEVIIPNSHNFVSGVCTKCGKVQDGVLITRIDPVAHRGTFPLGTLEGAIGLPAQINVYTADGRTHTLPVVWDLTTYNKAVAGEYTIHGIIQSGEYYYSTGLSNKISTKVKISERMVGTADIVFVLDISGSMSDEINHVKNNLQALANAIESEGVSARWSVVTYSDYTEFSSSNRAEQTQFVMNGASEWYSSAADCSSAIGRITLANGGDYEEVAIDGLMMAHTASTRTDARVFYILVTDAEYKNDNHYGVSGLGQAAGIFANESINVSVVTGTSLYSYYSALKTTGGIQASINGNFASVLCDSLVPIIYDEVIE